MDDTEEKLLHLQILSTCRLVANYNSFTAQLENFSYLFVRIFVFLILLLFILLLLLLLVLLLLLLLFLKNVLNVCFKDIIIHYRRSLTLSLN